MAYILIQDDRSKQGSAEWVQFRRGKIGGSDVASVMGINPFETITEAWTRILNDESKIPNEAMLRGTRLEVWARNWINDSLKVNYQPAVLQYEEHPKLIASLDGFYIDNQMVHHILEIKAPLSPMPIGPYEIPRYYYPQLQHQMFVSGAQEVLYLEYRTECPILKICKRDEDFITEMVKQELAFLDSLERFEKPKIWIGDE